MYSQTFNKGKYKQRKTAKCENVKEDVRNE